MVASALSSSDVLVVTPSVARQIADLTRRRFVAVYPIGFEIIVGDDGRSQFRVFDEDGLAQRLDEALARAVVDAGRHSWALYDQCQQTCRILQTADVRQAIRTQ